MLKELSNNNGNRKNNPKAMDYQRTLAAIKLTVFFSL